MNKDSHAMAVNVIKFQYYNFKFMECREIVLFETLIVLGGISFGQKEEFYHSTQTLVEETGIKRYTVDKILKRFKDLGLIEYSIKGMPQVKYIKVSWGNILELLPEIYHFDKVKIYFGGTTKPLIDFYKQYAENDKSIAENIKEENIKKNIKKEYKKEITYKIDVEENFKLMLKNERYVNMTMDKFHFTHEKFIEMYKRFNRQLVLKNDTKKTPKEYCSHFYSWYMKKFNINEITGKKNPTIFF